MDGLLTVDLTFDFAGIPSRAALEARLLNLRARGRLADALPGRILEKLPDLLASPCPSYDFAEVCFFLGAHAADNILNATVDWPGRLMDTVLERRIQFIGMAREHCLYTLRRFMFMRGLDAIPDCAGVSPAGYGDSTIPRYCAESNAGSVREALRASGILFQRTLAMIEPHDTPDRRLSQHELRYWIEGADLPAAQRIPVEVCWRNGRLDVGPAGADKRRLVQMGWDMPVYTVPKTAIVPVSREPGTGVSGPAWPVAAEGERYAVAKDCRAFYDKRDGKELAIETENARVAVRVFLKHAHGRRNAKSGEELDALLKAARIAQHLPPADTMALLHYFQKKEGGRRVTLDVYRLLIRKLPTQSLYWIEL